MANTELKAEGPTPIAEQTFELPVSGRTFSLIEAKGKHFLDATKIMGGNQDNTYPALMHVLVRVEGKKLPMEDYPEMPMADFGAIFEALNNAGFLF